MLLSGIPVSILICNLVHYICRTQALACSRLALKCNQLGALADDTGKNAVKKDNGAFVASVPPL